MDQTLAKLRDADVTLARGDTITEIVRKLEIRQQTYHRRWNQFGGMKGEELTHLVSPRDELPVGTARMTRTVRVEARRR